MRRSLIVAVFSALLFAAMGQQVETAGRVRQIAPGVFFRQGDRDRRQPANTSWVIFRDYVVVIDANTPWGIREILPEIRKTTDKPIRYVFDTPLPLGSFVGKQRHGGRGSHGGVLAGLCRGVADQGQARVGAESNQR